MLRNIKDARLTKASLISSLSILKLIRDISLPWLTSRSIMIIAGLMSMAKVEIEALAE
jgi:hypothetical protein